VGTYGGDYVLKSTTPISRSYGPVASSDRLWFGPQAFGQVGYRGILGDASMSAPADTPYVANHTFIDPAIGYDPAAFQEPSGTPGTDGQGSNANQFDLPKSGIEIVALRQVVEDVPKRLKALTPHELIQLVDAGYAIRSDDTIAVPVINDAGFLRWLVYSYRDAEIRPAIQRAGIDEFTFRTYISPADATFRYNLPGFATGAIFQDPAAEAARKHLEADLMFATLIISCALVPVSALEASAMAAARGLPGVVGVGLFGAGEIASQQLGVPIPINPASLLSAKTLVRHLQNNTLREAIENAPNRAMTGASHNLPGGGMIDDALPIRKLGVDRIKVTDRGIGVVENHLSRFGLSSFSWKWNLCSDGLA
jgi:hypothetical protein